MSTIREIHDWAKTDRYGRIALWAIRLGITAMLPPLALLLLHLELRNNPL